MTDEMKMKAIEWLLGNDTGVSSKAMCGALFGMTPAWACEPCDSADFGRCIRFIRFMPDGAKDMIFKNLSSRPQWQEIIKRWDELANLYDTAKGRGIYKILSSIREQFRKSPGNNVLGRPEMTSEHCA